MRFFKKFLYLSIILFGFAAVTLVFAQSVSLKAAKDAYRVGDVFTISLSLNTGGALINTLSGNVVVPTDKFQVLDVRYGNSIISLWVDRPKFDAAKGVINFTGGIPGGFSGSNGPVLSFDVRAKATGKTAIDFSEFKLLLNDGAGTELTNFTMRPLAVAISEALSKPKANVIIPELVYQPPPDIIPPEHFVPLISRHPTVADNKFFVAFGAVDKDSGVDRYEVKEEPFLLTRISDKFIKPFVKAESPYVLFYQLWGADVKVRAYDKAGNMVEEFAVKPVHPTLILIVAGFAVALSILILYAPRKPKRRGR